MKISDLINEIKRMKDRNAFRSFIEYIQFPYFRNLNKDTRITFDFPLTVFVGQNGSGKSSTLHALFGSPKKNTPYEFWFSTAVDPIEEVSEGGDRHCFFYVYKDDKGNELEVLKLRIFKKNNPDYWETSRPVLSYGMKKLPEGNRNQPIEKDVIYIDFRSELSAFDKYFYFKTPNKTKLIKTKQDFLRKYSVFLKKIVDGQFKTLIRYGKAQNNPVRSFTSLELESISYILGKKYISGRIVKHKLFEEWGYSVIFETKEFSYSEAFAGSGEMAVVRLVLEVLSANRYCLILLDEPEVSLHPGAQNRLKQFLLEEIRKKQLQIIISTHSPNIIEGLPANAIKVFSQLPTGKFHVKNENTAEEAFYYIEHTNAAKKTIIVEDTLSQDIIKGVLKEMGGDVESLFQIEHYTGGATIIKTQFINVFSHSNEHNKFIIFDGDQKLVNNHFNSDNIIGQEQTNQRYREEIKKQTGCDIAFYPDGNKDGGARLDQEKMLREKYLKYYLRNVFYLPAKTPEEIIWNDELAEDLLTILNKKEYIDQISGMHDFKGKFLLVAEAMTGDKKNIEVAEKTFLEKWLTVKNAQYLEIVEVISVIKGL